MKKDLQNKLFEKYPSLFQYRNEKTRWPIVFGIECSNGWYDLIDSSLEQIELADRDKKARIVQIKEKLAGLRIYVHNSNETIERVTSCVCCKSYTICESCGTKTLVNQRYLGYWKCTLCLKCFIKILIKRTHKDLIWQIKWKVMKLTKGRYKV